ncbi:MAG: hypothetical protein A2Z20_07340 [Bdellovibrionales bacterium RBG_16_40_8]|nr:MAG: hypothetical protein A2Z20_07340 [Bdellovibrionales bacterium RBG_16_40_8]
MTELLKNGGFWGWVSVFVLSLFLTVIIKGSLKFLVYRLQKLTFLNGIIWHGLIVQALSKTKSSVVFLWILYPLLHFLQLNEQLKYVAYNAVVIATVLQCGFWGFSSINYWREHFLNKKMAGNVSASAALGLLYAFMQGIFLFVLILIGLSNLGVDVAALLAGLGVGGIAIALAAQNVLGDLLASLSIVLDKPFVVSDYIVVGSEQGTVEHIGIKTTRVRSLSGEQLVFSNKDLLESRIHNFKRMRERRVIQKIGVIYSTPIEKLEQIPIWVKDIIEKYSKLRLDRCHFCKYGDSSLDFELVFWVSDPDYKIFMDHQEKLLLDIFRKFTLEKIEFAFPTQTLHIESLPVTAATT